MRQFFLMLTLCCSFTAKAQSVADMWISIPEDIVPYLTLNHRKEMIECLNIGVDTSVRNKFEGETYIKSLVEDYGCFVLSEVRDIQILRLPYQQDSIYCCIETLNVPEQSSRVNFYDKEWKKLSLEDKFPLAVNDSSLFCKPDTISMEEFEDIVGKLELRFVEYRYDEANKTLNIITHIPMLFDEDKNRIEAVISKKSLNWNGVMFN